MQELMVPLLRCPVSRTPLKLEVISRSMKAYNGIKVEIITEGLLFATEDWFYPVIDGIPRLIVEAFSDYSDFLRKHLPDYDNRHDILVNKYSGLIKYVNGKNNYTKKSFSQEWRIFNYGVDKTWDANEEEMINRFFLETDENPKSMQGKMVFDAGCGNGLLDEFIARSGATVLAMDLSESIIRAFRHNENANVFFIQGDVQFPPLAFEVFDIVHCSGVLICTNNTELSFSCIDPCVKEGGKLSVWVYHPRKDRVHNFFNFVRQFTSRLPLRLQYYLYLFTIFPISYVMKRMKGNKQNSREMMIDILDWFSPRFRWEHEQNEAESWFRKRNYNGIKVTTRDLFGYNMIGTKIKQSS
jgi:2-polyprenyl-3-methyl-5-hydroxy-6-metoxy-1,4-benzoquinol methylase/uncharacterized protein YbaR (Trm112 family)